LAHLKRNFTLRNLLRNRHVKFHFSSFFKHRVTSTATILLWLLLFELGSIRIIVTSLFCSSSIFSMSIAIQTWTNNSRVRSMKRANRVIISTIAKANIPCSDAWSLANVHTKKEIIFFHRMIYWYLIFWVRIEALDKLRLVHIDKTKILIPHGVIKANLIAATLWDRSEFISKKFLFISSSSILAFLLLQLHGIR